MQKHSSKVSVDTLIYWYSFENFREKHSFAYDICLVTYLILTTTYYIKILSKGVQSNCLMIFKLNMLIINNLPVDM